MRIPCIHAHAAHPMDRICSLPKSPPALIISRSPTSNCSHSKSPVLLFLIPSFFKGSILRSDVLCFSTPPPLLVHYSLVSPCVLCSSPPPFFPSSLLPLLPSSPPPFFLSSLRPVVPLFQQHKLWRAARGHGEWRLLGGVEGGTAAKCKGGGNVRHGGGNVRHGGCYVRHGGGNARHGGCNVRHGGGNVRHGGGNVRHGGGNVRHGGGNVRHGGGNVRHGGCNVRHGGGNVRHGGGNVRHGGGNVRHGGCNVRHGGGNVRHGGGNVRHGGSNVRHGGGNVRHGGGNVRHGGGNVRHGGGNVRHGGCNVRHGGGNVRHDGGNVRHSGGNLPTSLPPCFPLFPSAVLCFIASPLPSTRPPPSQPFLLRSPPALRAPSPSISLHLPPSPSHTIPPSLSLPSFSRCLILSSPALLSSFLLQRSESQQHMGHNAVVSQPADAAQAPVSQRPGRLESWKLERHEEA
ncbi:unnamed protein product [Closterium sp. NIES-64]|nr:unnamed protein product [Closterium sp. NIES-64]